MKSRVTIKINGWVIIIVALLLCLVIARLLYCGLSSKVDGMDLKAFAESRNTKTKTLYASRGTIYDANNEELAVSVNSYTLIAYLSESRTTDESDPQHVIDKDMTAEKLAPILKMEKSEILKYLNKDAYQVEFGAKGRNLTEVVKKQIDELELPGIDFTVSTQRYYKMGNFASYIIGYAKENEDGEIQGELGIESYYDNELSGEDGYEEYQSDLYGYQLPNVPSVTKKAKSGSDIYLTIDSNIQLILENALKKLDDDYDFDWAVFAVEDAKTGAIVGSATNPTYNPNDLNTLTSYLNPLVSYTYEPGSTMKTFSWASSMEEGQYDGTKTYMSGSINVADVTIKDFNKVGWGEITYDTGYAYSSNVGATKLALKLGVDKLHHYYDLYGFGKKTGIELSAEEEGDISFEYKSELATASFGQGITVTPIQILQALTALTNDGTMIKPYVVSKIVDDEGNTTYKGKRTEVAKTMSKETTDKMKQLMYEANYHGVSSSWQPSTVTLLAKTGTSQISSPKGGYLDGEYDQIYSLAGIFPDDEPRYILYVAVKRIIGSQRAVGQMTAKAVDEIAAYAKLAKTEETTQASKTVKLDNYVSKKVSDVRETLNTQNLNAIVLGSGEYIIKQYPKKGTKLTAGSKVFLVSNKDDYVIPDFTSWSLSDVKTYCKLAGIKYEASGYGYVVGQSIAANTPVNKDDTLTLMLEIKQ